LRAEAERLRFVRDWQCCDGPLTRVACGATDQVRQKQQSDPQYAFLFGGPDHPFYRWAMWCKLHNLNPDVPPMQQQQQQQQLGDPVRRRHPKTLSRVARSLQKGGVKRAQAAEKMNHCAG